MILKEIKLGILSVCLSIASHLGFLGILLACLFFARGQQQQRWLK